MLKEWPDWRGPMLPEPLRTLVAARNDGKFSGAHIVAKVFRRPHMALVQLRSRLPADQLWVSTGGRCGHVVKLGVLQACPHIHADPLLIHQHVPTQHF